MNIAKTNFEIDYDLAIAAKSKVPGLYDAGMDRTYRDLVNAVTLHLEKFVCTV